jgi:hypothetical protein
MDTVFRIVPNHVDIVFRIVPNRANIVFRIVPNHACRPDCIIYIHLSADLDNGLNEYATAKAGLQEFMLAILTESL